MMNFYHCAQPTWEDLEMMEAWDPETMTMQTTTTTTESPPAPGTPAPRLMVPLFPGRRRSSSTTAAVSSSTTTRGPVKPLTTRYLPPDMWRYHVLLFCDVSTLLSLNTTCRQLREVLNEPAFVVEWQTACWYLKERLCQCERNLFYLDVSQYLEFAWDALQIHSSRAADVALRSVGRSVNTDMAVRLPLPYVDPRKSPLCFMPGLLDIWYENWLVPMPRMVNVPVEDTQVRNEGTHDAFWLDHHPVPETDPDEVDTQGQRLAAEDLRDGPLSSGFLRTGPDLVTAYETDCRNVHRDPHDPAQDNEECLGYHATRWARRRLYETAVGVQTYPLHLCLRRSDLVGRAYRSGLSYLDTLFLPVQRTLTGHTDGEIQMLPHSGPMYFHPVRYNNEKGDFTNWALSTLAVTQGVYVHAWFDGVHHLLQRMDAFARELAAEVESDMPMYRMCDRWNHLHRRLFLGETVAPHWSLGAAFPDHAQESTQPATTASERQQKRDQAALDLMYDPHYAPYNRVMNRMANRNDEFFSSGFWAPYTSHYAYLTELLGDVQRLFPQQRTEATLTHELREMMQITDYIVRFAITIGPMTDPLTEVRRFRCLEAYLGAGTTLLMFAPSFRRIPSWRPHEKGAFVGARVPRIDLQANHRFLRYLRFLNRRTLYYVPQAHLPADAYAIEINPRS